MLLAALGLLIGVLHPTPSRADAVAAGYDLFSTDASGTTFEGANFQGVPLGTYNFGGMIGVQNVGNTDTIVQRLSDVTTPGTTMLVMDALQLETVAPTSLGGGPVGNYFITLQSTDGTGPASVGSMTINSGPNTFSSTLDVYFDVHFGSLNGAIVAQSNFILTSADTTWSHNAPAGSLLINGVNNLLDGTDTSQDFWPTPFTETESGATHTVDPASVPEPSVAIGLCTSLAGLGLVYLRQRKVKA
jgi:hypothetical protein